eukprot:1568086-Amphidinium_carterae.1
MFSNDAVKLLECRLNTVLVIFFHDVLMLFYVTFLMIFLLVVWAWFASEVKFPDTMAVPSLDQWYQRLKPINT